MKTARIHDDTHIKITFLQGVLKKSIPDVIEYAVNVVYARHYNEIQTEMKKQKSLGHDYPVQEEKLYGPEK